MFYVTITLTTVLPTKTGAASCYAELTKRERKVTN